MTIRPNFRSALLPLTLGIVTTVTACDTQELDAETVPLPAAAAKADGDNLADRQCNVVLREAGLLAGGTPVRTVGFEGGSHFVFGAVVDVAQDAVDAGAEVGLAGRPVLSVEPAEGSPDGFVRFVIEFVGPNAGTSFTSLNQATMEIIPFIEFEDGTRRFDHNRNPADFDNYRLVRGNSWKVANEELACPPADTSPAHHEEVLSCDGGAAVIDVDTNERRNLQLVVRDPDVVAALEGRTRIAYGVTHFSDDPAELIIRGATAEGVFDRGQFRWFETNASFETLDIWAPQGAAAARVFMEGSDLHVVILNNDGHAGQPRCDDSDHVTNCVVADWVFRNCG